MALELRSTEPLAAWLDVTPLDPAQKLVTELTAGTHTLTVRVALGERSQPELEAVFSKPAGSAAEFSVQ